VLVGGLIDWSYVLGRQIDLGRNNSSLDKVSLEGRKEQNLLDYKVLCKNEWYIRDQKV
jgi:hypothetical protein